MNQYKIIVGEDTDFPSEILKENNISVFNYTVAINDVPFTKSDLYQKMRENKKNHIAEYPRTSLPSVGTLKKLFEDELKENKELLVITISSQLSGTYNAAVQARENLTDVQKKNVYIWDSKHGSVSEALIVYKAIELLKKNSIPKTISLLDSLVDKVHIIVTINDTAWLEAGGRIGPLKATVIRQMMKMGIRPILSINQGKVELLKIKSNVKTKVDTLFTHFKEEMEKEQSKGTIRVIVSHGGNEVEGKELVNRLLAYNKDIKVEFVCCCSAVFGAHLGPDSLLLGWTIE